MKQRIQYIDRLKGVAMMSVLIIHVIVIGNLSETPDAIAHHLYPIAMSLFMFLSGLVISSVPWGKKLFKKLAVLLMPFFIVGTLFAFTCHHKNPVEYINNPLKYGYYYLLTLSETTIMLIPLHLNSFDNKKKELFIDITWGIIAWGILFFCRHNLPIQIQNILDMKDFYGLWPFFYLGYLSNKYKLIDKLTSHNVYFSIDLIVLLFLYSFPGLEQYGKLKSFALIIALCYLFRNREKENSLIVNLLGYIGKNSLDVYIFHYFILTTINLKDIGTWLHKDGNYFIEIILVTILAIFIAYLTILIGKSIKKSEWLKNIVYGKFIS